MHAIVLMQSMLEWRERGVLLLQSLAAKINSNSARQSGTNILDLRNSKTIESIIKVLKFPPSCTDTLFYKRKTKTELNRVDKYKMYDTSGRMLSIHRLHNSISSSSRGRLALNVWVWQSFVYQRSYKCSIKHHSAVNHSNVLSRPMGSIWNCESCRF